MTHDKVVSLILAGKRSSDPLSKLFNIENKAFIEIAGKPMVEWVLAAMQDSGLQQPVLMSITDSQEKLFAERLKNYNCKFISNAEGESPVTASLKALKQINPDQGLLITTADNPLLQSEVLKYFLQVCSQSKADLVIGTVNGQETLLKKYPQMRRTWHKLNPRCWLSGTNLFYWTPQGLNERAFQTLYKLEKQRKSPLAFASIAAKLDFIFLLKLILQRTNIEECSQALSNATNIKINLLALPFPEACIDVDTSSDLELVAKILNEKVHC